MSNPNDAVAEQYFSDKLNDNQKCLLKVKAILVHLKEVAPESKYTSELLKIDNSLEDSLTKLKKAVDVYRKYVDDMVRLACIIERENKNLEVRESNFRFMLQLEHMREQINQIGGEKVLEKIFAKPKIEYTSNPFLRSCFLHSCVAHSVDDSWAAAHSVEIRADELEHVSFDRRELTFSNGAKNVSGIEAQNVNGIMACGDMTHGYNSMQEYMFKHMFNSHGQESNTLKKKNKNKCNRQDENYDDEDYVAQEKNYDKPFEFYRTIKPPRRKENQSLPESIVVPIIPEI